MHESRKFQCVFVLTFTKRLEFYSRFHIKYALMTFNSLLLSTFECISCIIFASRQFVDDEKTKHEQKKWNGIQTMKFHLKCNVIKLWFYKRKMTENLIQVSGECWLDKWKSTHQNEWVLILLPFFSPHFCLGFCLSANYKWSSGSENVILIKNQEIFFKEFISNRIVLVDGMMT